jgi:hypothetical protein
MTIFTTVNEAYEITVYTTRKALVKEVAAEKLYLAAEIGEDEDKEPILATESVIVRALKKDHEVTLSVDGDREWTLKINRHD